VLGYIVALAPGQVEKLQVCKTTKKIYVKFKPCRGEFKEKATQIYAINKYWEEGSTENYQ